MHKTNKLFKKLGPLRCDTYLIDFIHPIAGELKHQLTGLHRSRHSGGVQRAGSSLKYPSDDHPGSFSAQTVSPNKMASLSSSASSSCCDLSSLVLRERDHKPSFRGVLWPRWEQPRPTLTRRLGPAAPGAFTPGRERGKDRERER